MIGAGRHAPSQRPIVKIFAEAERTHPGDEFERLEQVYQIEEMLRNLMFAPLFASRTRQPPRPFTFTETALTPLFTTTLPSANGLPDLLSR